MKKAIHLLSLLILFVTMKANAQYSQPNFAYPKTVGKNAVASLDKALADGDGKLLVRSLIDYGLAETAVDRDSLQPVLDRIAEITAVEKDVVTQSLLSLLQADIYNSIYQNNRWIYDRRELPASAADKDYSLWSGKQFSDKLVQLTSEALTDPALLQSRKLSDYSGVIKVENDSKPFYPTLYDFVAWRSIEILKGLSTEQPLFPPGWLCRYDKYSRMSFNYQHPVTKNILDTYRQLLDFHKGNAAPFINADISRIDFVSGGVENPTEKKSQLLYELYDTYSSSPYSAEALIAIFYNSYHMDSENYPEDVKRYYSTATGCIARHPGYFRITCLKNCVNDLTTKSLNLEYGSTLIPGDTLKITVKNNNVKSAKIEIYKVPYNPIRDSWSYDMRKGRVKAVLVKTLTVKSDKTAPFFSKTEENFVIEKEGAYIVVPVIDGKRADVYDRSFDFVHCTSLNLSTGAFGPERWAYVTDPKTGAPVKGGVTVTAITDNNTTKDYITGSDDATAKIIGKGNRIFATKGTDRYAATCYLPYFYPTERHDGYLAQGNTDLALYHPGDTVRWSAVIQHYSSDRPSVVAPGILVEVAMRDANSQIKDTVKVTSDEFGRISGEFRIPDEGLTGYYSLVFRHPRENDYGNSYGSTRFMVSDYKLPTYEVKITDILRDFPAKGDVTLKGKTETYSGFAIAGCNIAATLEASPRYRFWWGNSYGSPFYTTTVETDSTGVFSICFPAALLDESPIVNGIFTARLMATSPTGESRQTDRSFTTGKPYILSASLPAAIDATGNVRLDVTLSDLSGNPKTAEIAYKITDSDSTAVAEGTFASDKPVIDLTKVASGEYSILFHTVDPDLADSVTVSRTVIYRTGDNTCPVKNEILWIPVNKYTIKNRTADILFGTTGSTQHIRYAICSDSAMLKQGWMEVKPGLHHFTYDLPDGVDKINVTLATNYDYNYQSATIGVITDASLRRINLGVESFRDKIVPGQEERWTFTVRDRDGKGMKSALILDMYTKALDALQPHGLSLSPRRMPVTMFNDRNSGFNMSSSYDAVRVTGERCNRIIDPSFELWGRSWMTIYVRGYYSTMARAKGSLALNNVNTHADEIIVEEAAESYDAAAPVMMEKKMAMADAGSVSNDSEYEATEESAVTGAVEKKPDNFQYRTAETPLAFFRPELTTDSEGNLSFSFTAPNANTTWQLRALAFTKDLLVSDLSREILSSKPIMVQPNMPRFLRTGDKAVIEASVMNNSDSTATVNTVVELFDPFSGKTTATYNHTSTIAAGEAAIVSTEVNASNDMTAIGYRIKSSTDAFADGEQSVIPVLSSIAPVIDTMPFYISPDSTGFEMQLPEMPADARVTLQFCNNPAWYVVTALPGLRKEEAKDALSAAAAIFSAAIAEGILKTDSNIAKAIKMWNESDRSDSTLVSMLERNADLKTILLNCTPWVMDAKSDTERMERLALLFDPNVIADTYDKAVKQLAMLEAPRGGWSWIGQVKEPSSWITESVLTMMGKLKRLGYLPANSRLEEMMNRGVSYLDRNAAEVIKDSPQATDMGYALMRLDYPEISVPAGARKLINNTVAEANAHWKDYDVERKALAARLLYGHKYRTVSRNILASLREYATVTSQKGMWWASLDDISRMSMGKVGATATILETFYLIEPQSPDVERIRQWLILQKEAKNWGTSVTTSNAIAAILLSGKPLTKPAEAPVVKVGDKNVAPDTVDSLLGYFRQDISGLAPSGKTLSVTKQEGLPSWGAVFCQYRSEMSEIKAASCDDVSIEKMLFVKSSENDKVVWFDADSVKVGDLVQVNLIITTKRDMDYVAIIDDRGACFEPVEQLPQPLYSEGICFYRENRDEATNIFVTHLPKGTYRLSYELFVNNAGQYSTGVASLQSQYAPALSAHSSGTIINASRQ